MSSRVCDFASCINSRSVLIDHVPIFGLRAILRLCRLRLQSAARKNSFAFIESQPTNTIVTSTHARMARNVDVRRFVISSPSARSLLLTRRNCSGRSLNQGRCVCLRCRAAELWPHTFSSPQFCALDRSDEFAAHWFLGLYRLGGGLGHSILSECIC
jgi:hypothetical protein